jgi:putative transposase
MKLARLHRRIADIRRDALHQLTTYLVQNYDEVVIEDLNVSGMQRNRRVARHIADIGFHEFRRQVAYKAERAGVRVTVVDRWEPTSKRCSGCGHIHDGLQLSERSWTCGRCHNRHDRDLNAAVNLKNLAASWAVKARGVDGPGVGGDADVNPTTKKREPVTASL